MATNQYVSVAVCVLGDPSPRRLVDQEIRILSDRRPGDPAHSCGFAVGFAARLAASPTRVALGAGAPALPFQDRHEGSGRRTRAARGCPVMPAPEPGPVRRAHPVAPPALSVGPSPAASRHHATWSQSCGSPTTLRDISRSVVAHSPRSRHAQRPPQVSGVAGAGADLSLPDIPPLMNLG